MWCILVSVLHRTKTNRMFIHVFRERGVDFKELFHTTIGAGKF